MVPKNCVAIKRRIPILLLCVIAAPDAWSQSDSATSRIPELRATAGSLPKVIELPQKSSAPPKKSPALLKKSAPPLNKAPVPYGSESFPPIQKIDLEDHSTRPEPANMIPPSPTRAEPHHVSVGGVGSPIAVPPAVGRGALRSRGYSQTQNNLSKSPYVPGQDVDFGPYMADLQRRIKRAWRPPEDQRSIQEIVRFKIKRNGNILDLRLDPPTGIASADEAALKAVEGAAPFRPLPAGSLDDVSIQFTLDYYADKYFDDSDQPYKIRVENGIQRAWGRPKGFQDRHVAVLFDVQKSGLISNIRIKHESGLPAADKAALQAVIHASPFPKSEIDLQTIVVDFFYDSGGDGRVLSESIRPKQRPGDRAFAEWLTELQSKLTAAWRTRGLTCTPILVQFDVTRDGNVSEISVPLSSGSSRFDDAATDTVKQSAPFKPLPPGEPKS